MTDPTRSSTDYKFSIELLGHTSPLSRCRNTNSELTSSLKAQPLQLFNRRKSVINSWPQSSSQAQLYNQDEEVKLFGIV